ncbi:unknown [Firmicutes bacterium CAG:822]|nr:unknown [Firmicutes bacterium CAG:822]
MTFMSEYDDNNNLIKESLIDKYGNEEVSYLNEDLDKELNGIQLFKDLGTFYKLQLTINKQMYESGDISKELYNKVEDIILDRIKPFQKYINN